MGVAFSVESAEKLTDFRKKGEPSGRCSVKHCRFLAPARRSPIMCQALQNNEFGGEGILERLSWIQCHGYSCMIGSQVFRCSQTRMIADLIQMRPVFSWLKWASRRHMSAVKSMTFVVLSTVTLVFTSYHLHVKGWKPSSFHVLMRD